MSLLNELKRRNVFRVGLVYLASSWLIAQVASLVAQWLELPSVVMKLVLIVLAIGFPIALIVAWLFELTPEGLKRTSEVEASVSIRPLTGRKLDRLLIGVLSLVVALLLADRFLLNRPADHSREAGMPAAVSDAPSIAVLPFVNLSSDPEQDYFADGITEELLNSLARIKDLRVTGRTSSFYFKGKNEDLRAIGEKLGVENILEGSVRKAGDQVRITAQLNNARTGYHLWSRTYDRKFEDIFAIQEDIAHAVAEALEITLGVGELGSFPDMTRNVRAYEQYLLSESDRDFTPESISRAIGHLERAVEIDPNFSRAWLDIWDASHTAPIIVGENQAYLEKSAQALAHARALTPDSPFVLQAEWTTAINRGDWLEADRLIDRALDAADRYSLRNEFEARTGGYFIFSGRVREGITMLERASATDPLNTRNIFLLAIGHASARDFDAAFAGYDRIFMMDDSAIGQTVLTGAALSTALASGRRAEIEKALSRIADRNDGNLNFNVRMGRFLDDPQAGLAALRDIVGERESMTMIGRSAIALWAIYYGDTNLALEMLRRPFNGDVTTAFLALNVWQPIYRDVRKLEDFKDFVRDIGMEDYWRTTGKWNDFCHPIGDDDFECS